jgi:hypothetical protein
MTQSDDQKRVAQSENWILNLLVRGLHNLPKVDTLIIMDHSTGIAHEVARKNPLEKITAGRGKLPVSGKGGWVMQSTAWAKGLRISMGKSLGEQDLPRAWELVGKVTSPHALGWLLSWKGLRVWDVPHGCSEKGHMHHRSAVVWQRERRDSMQDGVEDLEHAGCTQAAWGAGVKMGSQW